MEVCVNSGLPIAIVPCLYQNNISKGSYGEGDHKNVNCKSMQKAYGPVRACKLPGFMQRRIGLSMKIWVNSGITIAMVPCLHQSNVISKGSCGKGEPKNANPESVQKSVLTCTGVQTTRFHAAPYKADNENLRKFEATYRHGTMFAPKQYLFQKEAVGKENSQM